MTRRLDALRFAYWNCRCWTFGFAWRLLRTVTFTDWLACLWLFPIRRPGRPTQTDLTLRAGPHLRLRTYSSDPDVFRQVFVERQYDMPFPVTHVNRIIDGGANIGLSSVYFLLKYPAATVVAVEPDPDNYQLAVVNTARFGARCRLLQAALWSHGGRLFLKRGDGAWGTQVQADASGDTQVQAVTLAGVCDDLGWPGADIVKLDIEGAETEVLATDVTSTTARGRCWAIELHSDAARAAFDALFSSERWIVSRRGEVTFASSRSEEHAWN